jgi:effector-binding domain-containing protein
MIVDFALKRVAPIQVASIVRVGPWKEENLRTEFEELTRWARREGIPTGRWIFLERNPHRWEACLEIHRLGAATGRIRVKRLPSARVASVLFDPTRLSSRIVYHGLRDWVRRRDGRPALRMVRVREVYPGDPWRDRRAWARCDVQFLVRPSRSRLTVRGERAGSPRQRPR